MAKKSKTWAEEKASPKKIKRDLKKLIKLMPGVVAVECLDTTAAKDAIDQGDFTPGMDLEVLRIANVARSQDPRGFDHPLNAWSVAEWTNALCGEAGEAANVAKKLLRIRKKTRGNHKKEDKSEKRLLKKLASEIAGAVMYADLVLASEGISLSEACITEYNKKSKEIGFDFKL